MVAEVTESASGRQPHVTEEEADAPTAPWHRAPWETGPGGLWSVGRGQESRLSLQAAFGLGVTLFP